MSRWRKRNASSPASVASSGRTSSLRTSAEQPLAAPAARPARAPGPRRGGRPVPRRRRARARLARPASSWSSRAARSAWIVGGTATSPSPDSRDDREHLLDEQRVALRGVADPRAQLGVQRRRELVDQLLRLLVRAARAGRVVAFTLPPAQPGRRSSSSGRAMQRSRIGASAAEVGHVLDQVEEASARPSAGRRRRTTSGRSARGLLEQLSERPGDLVARASSSGSPRAEAIAAAACSSRAARRAACSTSMTRPVGDPLAVGEAAPARRPSRRAPPRNSAASRDFPTPAGSEEREEVAGALATDAFPKASASSRSSRARGRPSARRAGARARRRSTASSRKAGTGSALALQRQRLDRLGLDGVPDEAVASRRRSGPRPAAAACSSRAATLTASPVASRSPGPGDDLAGGDADAAADAELGQRVPHLDRRPSRAQRVVLVERPGRRRRPSPRRR